MLGRRVTHFEVQMRASTSAGVAAPPQGVAGLKRQTGRGWGRRIQSHRPPLVGARDGPLLHVWGKPLKVGVDRGDAAWAFEVKRVPVAPWRHLHAGQHPVGRGEDRQTLPPLGFHVKARVKVVATELSEVATQDQRHRQRIRPTVGRFEFLRTLTLRPLTQRRTRRKNTQHTQHVADRKNSLEPANLCFKRPHVAKLHGAIPSKSRALPYFC